jgi:hypothetical protein
MYKYYMSREGKQPAIPRGKSLIDQDVLDKYIEDRTRYAQTTVLSKGLAPRTGNYKVPTNEELYELDNSSSGRINRVNYTPEELAHFIEVSNATRDRHLAEGNIGLAIQTTRLIIKMLNLVKMSPGYSKEYDEDAKKRQELQSKQQQEILLNLVALKGKQKKNGGKRKSKTRHKNRKNKTKRKGKKHRGGNKTMKLWSSGDRSPGEPLTSAPVPASVATAPMVTASAPSKSFLFMESFHHQPPMRRTKSKKHNLKIKLPGSNNPRLSSTPGTHLANMNAPQEMPPETHDWTGLSISRLQRQGRHSKL